MSPSSDDIDVRPDDSELDKTVRIDAPGTFGLLRNNVGRILGQMLGGVVPGVEKEGDCIGPYRLCERLGEGGFGNVWRAEQTEPVRREVAVKVIKLGMDTLQVLGRFDQERQALASMDHPNIAAMIEAGVSPHGRPYFAMELVRGEPITQWCRVQCSPLQERLHIFHQVCLAVQHAHQKGVIHRDLKPSNILVTRIDSHPVPKVIDFGIAKAVHADGVERTLLTYAEDVVGTPRYMSPEQIECRTVIDTRSDIYSLGVLLYELLTGAVPYEADGSAEELKQRISETSPRRPSTQIKGSRKSRKQPAAEGLPESSMPFHSLPADLDWITMRALEKECARRYQTAAEFAADIQRFLENEPVLARPPSLRYVTGRWVRRHRTVFAAACLIVLAMVTGTSVALWQAQLARAAQRTSETEAILARQAEHQADISRQQAEMAQQQAQQTAGFIIGLLDRVSLEVRNGRNPEALKAALSRGNEEILQLKTRPELRIDLLEKVQGIYSTIGENKLAIPLARSKASELAVLHGPASPEAFAAELSYLKMVVDFGARATGPELIENLRHRVEAAGGRGSKLWFEVQTQLSRTWIKLDIPDKALSAAEELMAEARAQKLTPRGAVGSKITLATALEFAGRYDEALNLLQETRGQTNDTGHFIRIDERVIFLLQRRGDLKRGAELLRIKLAEQQADHGAGATELIPVLRLLAEFESKNAEHSSAIVHAQQVLAIAHKQQSADDNTAAPSGHKVVWQALLDLADCESAAGQHQNAIAHAEESLRFARKMDNEQMITRSLRDLSDFHRDAGNLDLACDIKRQSYHRIRQSGANLRDAEQDLREICNMRLEQNRPEEALKVGLELWTEIQARPESKDDVAHVGQVAEAILKSVTALKAVKADATDPHELAAWQAAVNAAKTLNSSAKQTMP